MPLDSTRRSLFKVNTDAPNCAPNCATVYEIKFIINISTWDPSPVSLTVAKWLRRLARDCKGQEHYTVTII